MSKFNIYDMDQLKNVNEKRVWKLLAFFLDTYGGDVCQCNICVVDMAAITLNNIKPCYQFNENIRAAEQAVSDDEILEQIEKAMETVSKRPHH